MNVCSDAINQESDESAAREVVHDRAHDRICRDSFEQSRAAGDDRHPDHQDCADDGDDLLDALLARADAGDMLADARAAVGAYSATLDDQVGIALGAFDFGSQRHRGLCRRRYEVRNWLARVSRQQKIFLYARTWNAASLDDRFG